MFVVDQLCGSVDGRTLFENVSFEVTPAERLAVTGPSGAGKTTLLRAIAGLDPLKKGSVFLDGRAIEDWDPAEYRRRVLYVHQRPAFVTGTIREALARPFSFASSSKAFDARVARSALDEIGLEKIAIDNDIARLSEGERQRVALVRAVLVAPLLYLLDEPTSALDSESEALVEAMLSRQNATVIFVTHRAGQSQRWATKHLRLGRLDMESSDA